MTPIWLTPIAQATFTASGIVADKQKTVVSTRPVEIVPQREELQTRITEVLVERDVQRHIRRWLPNSCDDPIAQTFEVDANHENGIFASELEVFFRTKDDVVPVEAYLVPTEAHMPVHSIIPMSRVVVNPDTIFLGSNVPWILRQKPSDQEKAFVDLSLVLLQLSRVQ